MELATCIDSQAIGTETVHTRTSGSRTCLELADMELATFIRSPQAIGNGTMHLPQVLGHA